MGAAKSLRHLLATGQLHRSVSRSTTRAAWSWRGLSGRTVELTARGPAARLTAAAALVVEAQHAQTAVAWITARDAPFHPPDLADAGVDLRALVVVFAADATAMLRACDTLLRSGAFGLVVLDHDSSAHPSPLPLAAQTRLVGLAKKHGGVLLRLCPHGDHAHGSLASLRMEATLQRTGPGRFANRLTAVKDRSAAPGWQHVQACRSGLGMG